MRADSGADIELQQSKYLNNVVEQDHRTDAGNEDARAENGLEPELDAHDQELTIAHAGLGRRSAFFRRQPINLGSRLSAVKLGVVSGQANQRNADSTAEVEHFVTVGALVRSSPAALRL
jgi:hypothetical protein